MVVGAGIPDDDAEPAGVSGPDGDALAGRVHPLNALPARDGRYVLYWMQQSQRAVFNHAFEYAAGRANAAGLPLVVGFGLTGGYPDANLRHYTFMLEGLAETAAALRRRGAAFVLRIGDPAAVALALGREAAVIVCDRGYLRHQKAWRRRVAAEARCAVVQVESDVIVPVHEASAKPEFAARTLRPKLQAQLTRFLRPLAPVRLACRAERLGLSGEDVGEAEPLVRRLRLDTTVAPVTRFFRGGTRAAERLFRRFLRERLAAYRAHRNQPQTNDVSHMSKYLHFGQVSPVWLAIEARAPDGGDSENVESFIDELLVRRELSMNWCEFTERYDEFESLPAWARATLRAHRRDRREYVYTQDALEAARTHDEYWNAGMREMRVTGYMHNYMRMYWGKKILEWSPTPEEAHARALAISGRACRARISRAASQIQPSSSSNRTTRARMSSRMARTPSAGSPFGSGSGQSSRCRPGTTGHASPHPIVTRCVAVAASSGVSFCGTAAPRSRPISRMTATTSGWTREPGSVPAEIARARPGAARLLKSAAAICDRPALWIQAKRTRPITSASELPQVCTSDAGAVSRATHAAGMVA